MVNIRHIFYIFKMPLPAWRSPRVPKCVHGDALLPREQESQLQDPGDRKWSSPHRYDLVHPSIYPFWPACRLCLRKQEGDLSPWWWEEQSSSASNGSSKKCLRLWEFLLNFPKRWCLCLDWVVWSQHSLLWQGIYIKNLKRERVLNISYASCWLQKNACFCYRLGPMPPYGRRTWDCCARIHFRQEQ